MPLNAAPFRKRPMSMTSLIDVIFLLLLYFMLSSTFLRHGEIALITGTAGVAAPAAQSEPLSTLFLQLRPEATTLNGRPVTAEDLSHAVHALLPEDANARAILSLDPLVEAQALADVLVVLRQIAGLQVEVIR